jgi:flagellar biosynthesis protein FliQ
MDPVDAIELGRQALGLLLLIGSPVLLIGLAVGLIVGLLQALTQVQEATVAFVPKLLAMTLAISALLPWMITHWLEYATTLISDIPTRL